MTNDAKLEEFQQLNPRRYVFLEAFELSREMGPEGCSDFRLRIVLRRIDFEESRLVLTFEGVRDLQVGRMEGLMRLFVEVRSIREHQLEGLNYRIVESEYETFSFHCKTFQASVEA